MNIYHLSFRDAYAVRYKPLPGEDVRTLEQQSGAGMIDRSIEFLVNRKLFYLI